MVRHVVPIQSVAARRAAAIALVVLAASAALAFVAPGHARAAGAADAQASELVRLLNGERAYRRLSPLRVDPFLARKARDGSIACPNDASDVMAGRARDMATSGTLSHALRLCPSYSVLDVMNSGWGYTGARGEVMAQNGGYGTGEWAYSYGCTNNQTSGCPGATTYTYRTTARAAANLMSSSTHRAIVLGSFDRIGCGAWISSSGAFYYDCILSRGGPNATVAPPTTPPFAGPARTPTPTRRSTTSPPALPPRATPAATRAAARSAAAPSGLATAVNSPSPGSTDVGGATESPASGSGAHATLSEPTSRGMEAVAGARAAVRDRRDDAAGIDAAVLATLIAAAVLVGGLVGLRRRVRRG